MTMEWIQRNPKKAAGLAALVVLVLVIFVWGMSRGSSAPAAEPTLGSPTMLATPTTTPSRLLDGLPSSGVSPTGGATSIAQALNAFPSAGMGNIGPGLIGSGGTNGLPPHRVVIEAGSDGPLLGVGWRIPTADGARKGKDLSYKKSFRHAATAYGRPDYAQLFTRVGPNSSVVWCTVTVDGKVTERQEAHGPWGGVFCQG
jgi:hypothetical protein